MFLNLVKFNLTIKITLIIWVIWLHVFVENHNLWRFDCTKWKLARRNCWCLVFMPSIFRRWSLLCCGLKSKGNFRWIWMFGKMIWVCATLANYRIWKYSVQSYNTNKFSFDKYNSCKMWEVTFFTVKSFYICWRFNIVYFVSRTVHKFKILMKYLFT